MKKPKILFYDIETTPLQAWVWRCGKQVVRHDQLVEGRSRYNIICITYCWNDGGPVKSLDWDYEKQDDRPMIEEFDEMIKESDLTIGKNSDRFDVKQINTRRLFGELPGMPDWSQRTDDLEKQMRKHFYLPSYSLDYLSNELGLGGKVKMKFQDWIDIVEKGENGEKAFNKMLKYGKKDTRDTRTIWYHCEKHFTPKLNQAAYYGDHCCATCGSTEIHKNGTRLSGQVKYQRFYCNDHGGYAGKCPILKSGKLGKMR